MIQKKFVIDPEKKLIRSHSKTKTYSVQELYSDLMNTFDNPEFMQYDLPIKAVSKSKFKMINGWRIGKQLGKHLKGNLL